MTTAYETDQDLLDAGFLALREVLGPEDAFRFVRLLRPGPGNYTEERVLHTGNPTISEIVQRIEERKRREHAEEISAASEEATVG